MIDKIWADSAVSRQPLNLTVTYGLPYLILDLTGDGQPRHSHDLFSEGALVAEVGSGEPIRAKQGGVMAKRHCRPSAQYRYEHYDPFV